MEGPSGNGGIAGGMSPRSCALAHARDRSKWQGCSKISDYEVLGKLGEGTFGEVHRARSRKTGAVFALKKIIIHNEKDGFPITALREIKLLKSLSHENILRLEEMAVEHPLVKHTEKRKKPIMYMVTPYMDHDLSGLLDNPSVNFTVPQIKCYMLQLLEGLRYLHDNHILHRDMKAANLLINNKGILQIADFGLARVYEGSTPKPGQGSGQGQREYTGLVVTRWYRPPELLLQLKRYTPAIDVWGVGCVFGEMLTGKPILAGDSDSNQLEMIWDLVGTATEDAMPGWNSLPGAEGLQPRARPGCLETKFKQYGPGAVSLLKDLMKLDWKTRVNAHDALRHPYFQMDPRPARPSDLPTFEESHELDRRKYHDRKAALPPAPKGGAVGMGADAHNTGDPYANGGRGGANGGRYPPPPPSNASVGSYRPGGGPPSRASEDRRNAWHRENGLPPRPPVPLDRILPPPRDYDDRDRRPRSRGGGGSARRGGDIDTYYRRDDRSREDRRPPPRDDMDRAWERDRRTRSRSRSPLRRDRDRDRDRDRERDRGRERNQDRDYRH